MDYIGFLIACCLSFHASRAFSEEFLKRLTQPKPGGILDALKQPKIPGINIQLGANKQFGVGIGSFGFGFSLGGQYGKGGINLPPAPSDPHLPDLKPEVPSVPKPQYPWENEKGNNKPRPNWEEYEEDEQKHGPYQHDKAKPNPYEEDKANPNPHEEDNLPDWSEIGEIDREDEEDFEKKSERFNNGDLTGGGLIQPRRNLNRGRRSVESHIYHVPLLFRSNAKPFQVRVHGNPNTLTNDGSGH